MKPRHKPRPDTVYREERKNELGEWVCSRQTFDPGQYRKWLRHQIEWVRKFGPGQYPGGEHRYLVGSVTWGPAVEPEREVLRSDAETS